MSENEEKNDDEFWDGKFLVILDLQSDSSKQDSTFLKVFFKLPLFLRLISASA